MNIFRKKETIFWLTYSSAIEDGGYFEGDRRAYFKGRKTLREFHNWLEDARSKIEKLNGRTAIITNLGIIER